MNFDVSKVYTAVNADELHKGDLVFGADTFHWLKAAVRGEAGSEPNVITGILTEDDEYRFTVGGMANYQLAYLVCPSRNVEAYKAWRCGEPIERQTDDEDCTDEDWTDVDSDELKEDSSRWFDETFRVKQCAVKETKDEKRIWHIVKDEGSPTKKGLYLCYRIWNYQKVYELIAFDGEYWVTDGMPEDRILAWCELPELPKEMEQ